MSPNDFTKSALQRACLSNAEAMDFLQRWVDYIHGIDDLIDEQTNAEFRIGLFIRALEIYNHPFYLKHRLTLNPVILNTTNLYADSVAWEQSEVAWQREFADYARHGGGEMVMAVAGIVGGYPHMRAISQEFRAVNYCTDHQEKVKTQ